MLGLIIKQIILIIENIIIKELSSDQKYYKYEVIKNGYDFSKKYARVKVGSINL